MNPFQYQRTDQLQPAIEAISGSNSAKFLAGGTNLVDLMKNGVETPALLIDINRLPLAKLNRCLTAASGLAHWPATATPPIIRWCGSIIRCCPRRYFPARRHSFATSRPMAATCYSALAVRTSWTRVFHNATSARPAAVVALINRMHAILGASAQCIATHPSDMCVALIALEARVRVYGHAGERVMPIDSFHRLPGDTPQIDTNLKSDELVVSIDLPPSPYAGHSHYLKVRDRASYEFALVSVAAALELHEGTIKTARIAMGGVAHKPWRSQNAEAVLIGHKPAARIFQAAAQEAVKGATPYRYNQFKVELTQRAIVRALSVAGDIQWA